MSESLESAKARRVRAILAERRRREEVFADVLFTDPAWDILLELYWGELVQHRFATNELCESSAVAATTALRWIAKLESGGWLIRVNDPDDGRRVFVGLSPKAIETMNRYFDAVGRYTPVV